MSMVDWDRAIDELDWHQIVLIFAALGLCVVVWLLGLWKMLELEWSLLNYCWDMLR